MKIAIIFLFVTISLLAACSSLKDRDEVAEFIPGTYVRVGNNEFGKEYDTLVISIQNKEAWQFKIVNKWLYNKKIEGQTNEPEYKVKETSGIYNTETKLLEEAETLDHYSFDVKQKVLFDGTNKYFKIK